MAAIDRRLRLLQMHLPYHESDHVLNFALNALGDATCLQDMELRRNDEVSAKRSTGPLGRLGRAFPVRLRRPAELVQHAENLAESAWKPLKRPPAYTRQGPPRTRPRNVKRQVVRRRAFLHKELHSEQVAEFDYRPGACQQAYRMVVVRKNITQEKGERRLFDELRYFFYLTNDRVLTAAEIVFGCNDRCDQENLIAQLSGGVRALAAPLDNLVSNGAYMRMTALA